MRKRTRIPSLLIQVATLVAFFLTIDLRGAIKVACCGDSITAGIGVPDRTTQGYPAVLQTLLGPDYEVVRFATSGLTLLKNGDYSFWDAHAYPNTIAAAPDIIIILLGTNDSKPRNWEYAAQFEADYHALIDDFSAISSQPKIMLALPPPSHESTGGIRDSVITHEIIPKILKVATQRNLEVIDTNTPFQDKRYLMPDGIHPGVDGYELIADIVQDAIINGGSITPTPPPLLSATPGNAEASLSWGASAGAASYNIKRATTSGGPFATIATGVTATAYTDTGLTNDTTYTYAVSAVISTVGESPDSTAVSVTPTDPPPPASVTAVAGNTQVSLSWIASSGATSYNLKRSTTVAGPYTTIATGVTSTSYMDAGLTNNATYYYVVSGVNSVSESPDSAPVTATPSDPPTPIEVTATPGRAQVSLAWTTSPGATSYNIKRSMVGGGPYSTIVTSVAGTSHIDTELTFGVTHYYVVSAVNAAGESSDSTEVFAIPRVPTPPPAPTGLSATAGDAQVSLSWTASTGAVTYNVKRATVDGGPYTTIANGVTNTSYTDTGLTNGTTYYYVVSGVNAGGQGPKSAQVSATPTAGTTPPAPTDLTAVAGDANVVLSWSPSETATSYRVKQATVDGGPYSEIATDLTETSYTDAGLTNGTTYYYVVSALNPTGESADSAQVSATPATPGALPSPWQSEDIGAVGVAGNASYSDGSFLIAGSGADISGPRDAFRYIYQISSGNCSVVARVVSVQNTHAKAKAGVMIRETLNIDSANATIVMTPKTGIKFQWRTYTGASTTSVGVAKPAAPYWLKLTRTGDSFAAYHSADGVSWEQLGPTQTIAMGATAYLGLAVTSHNYETLCTAELDNVTATP